MQHQIQISITEYDRLTDLQKQFWVLKAKKEKEVSLGDTLLFLAHNRPEMYRKITHKESLGDAVIVSLRKSVGTKVISAFKQEGYRGEFHYSGDTK